MIEVLLFKGVLISSLDRLGNDSLFASLTSSYAEMACLLLSRGAPVTRISSFMLNIVQWRYTGAYENTLRACLAWITERDDEIIEGDLLTALHGAPHGVDDALLQLLAEVGLRPNSLDKLSTWFNKCQAE
jgi:hypothetical protein